MLGFFKRKLKTNTKPEKVLVLPKASGRLTPKPYGYVIESYSRAYKKFAEKNSSLVGQRLTTWGVGLNNKIYFSRKDAEAALKDSLEHQSGTWHKDFEYRITPVYT